jgi:hypothetical protein
MIYNTPEKFIVKTNHRNPPSNDMIFEEYFYNYYKNINIETERYYIPVLWTNFYLSRGNGDGYMTDLQEFLYSLDKTKKYFTVLQYDDAILQNIDDIDIQVFCGGGGGKKIVPEKNLGYPIPLNCKPNQNINKNRERDILCSFMGSIIGRHKIREQLYMKYSKRDKYYITQSEGHSKFKDVMERSVFSLCPRGYGATSFRICESLQHGSIPIYVYDKPWIPWKDEFDFNNIGILISENEIDNIPEIIENKSNKEIKKYLDNGERIYKEYFDYEGCAKKIINKINA